VFSANPEGTYTGRREDAYALEGAHLVSENTNSLSATVEEGAEIRRRRLGPTRRLAMHLPEYCEPFFFDGWERMPVARAEDEAAH